MPFLLKEYNELKAKLRFLLDINTGILINDMKKSPVFDPSHPYDEKNQYFNNANQIGKKFLTEGLAYIAEVYYQQLLDNILQFEQQNSKNFNKGIVFANLGISQMAFNKFSEGMANLLKAHNEDKPFYTNGHDMAIFGSDLYTQFENRIISTLKQNLKLFAQQECIKLSEEVIKKLIVNLSIENRLFLTTIIREINENCNILKKNDNSYTKILLFSSIKNLCLFIENLMKKIIDNDPQLTSNLPSGNPSLKKYINVIHDSKPWKPNLDNDWNIFTKSLHVQQFQTNLQSIFQLSNNNLKRLFYLGCVRNFSGHHFDIGSSFFFQNFEEIFHNILSVVFWLLIVYWFQ